MRYAWLLIVPVCMAVYANSLEGDFHYDDEHSVEHNIHLRDLGNVPRFFADPAMFSVDADKGMYRPVLLITYAVNHALGGFDVWGYHAVNVGIHAANACLVWWLASLLGVSGPAAVLAGLLFAVHPACTEPVNYVSSRSESLAALFYLLGLALWVRGRGRGRLVPIVWVCLALGLLTKSTAITLPVCLLVFDYLYLSRRDLGRLRSRLARFHLPGWGVCAAYLAVIVANGFLTRSAGNRVRGWGEQLATQAKAPAYYLNLLAAPVNQSVEPQFAGEHAVWSAPVLLSLALVASMLALLWLAWRWRARRVAFLLVWAGVALLPVLIFPLNVLVNERRIYLSCAALCIGLASALPLRELRVHARSAAALGLVLVLGILTLQRNRVWADDFSLWGDAVAKGPLMPRPQLYLGNAHKDAALATPSREAALEHWRAAEAQYDRVRQIGSDRELSVRALNNTGSVQFKLGQLNPEEMPYRLRQAAEVYREALAIKPEYDDALVNLGNVELTLARSIPGPVERRQALQKCIELYKAALKIRPNHPQAHSNLGVVYQDLGQWERAGQAYERALAITPRDFNSLANMGGLLLQQADRPAPDAGPNESQLRRAASYFRQALQLNPNYEPAQRGMAEVARRLQGR